MKKMNRRADLLARAQRMSAGEYSQPAIHPRYRGAYRYMYDEKKDNMGSLGFRVFISLFLFVAFTTADRGRLTVSDVDCDTIAKIMEREYTVSEVRDFLHGRQGVAESE